MYGDTDAQHADAPASTQRVTEAARERPRDEPVRRPPASRMRPGFADRTDAQLLRLARDGDPTAYEAIVARYREPLRRSCARIVPDRAEDAVQQALLSAWMALERGAEVRELRPWLYSIARNAAIDQARGIRFELVELGPEVAGGEDPAHAEAQRREMTEVLEAVAALPDRQRRALVDTALHGRPTEAVAVDLGLSGGALRQLVHRARTTVRAAVPSIAFPIPAWLVELLGEEGSRRGVVLLGSGSGAAVLAKATATVATVGAVVAGSIQVDQIVERQATVARTAAPPPASSRSSSGAATVGPGAPALIADVTVFRPTASAATARSGDLQSGQPAAPSGGSSPGAAGTEHSRSGHSGSDGSGAQDGSPFPAAVTPTGAGDDERQRGGDHHSKGGAGRRGRDRDAREAADDDTATEASISDAPQRPSRRDGEGSGSGRGGHGSSSDRDDSRGTGDRGSGSESSGPSSPWTGGGSDDEPSESSRGSGDAGRDRGSASAPTASGSAPATAADDDAETAERDNSRSAPSQQ